MQSVSIPLNRLHEDGSWFARAHEIRLWIIRCDDNLRGSVLRMVPKLEFHADNRSHWPVLPDAHTAKDEGWTFRTNRLAADWSARVDAFAREGIAQGTVNLTPGSPGLQGFIRASQAVLAAQREPLAGIIAVLTPGVVERPAALYAALSTLLADPQLGNMRWVVVLDIDAPVPEVLLRALGPTHSLISEIVVDKAQQRRDLGAMLSPGAPRFGMASPLGVSVPGRVDDPPPLPIAHRDEALRAAGINPALLELGPELRAAVLGAALAMSEDRGPNALEHQRRACDLCERLGLVEMQVIAQITLASYLSALDRRDDARRELLDAIATARAKTLRRVESQAHFALGLLYNLDREPTPAIRAYEDAARVAEAGDEPAMAIEGWRMAGQLAGQSRQEQKAEAAFREALRVAAGADPEVARSSSAAEAARQLAKFYTERGTTAQADALYALADKLERGEEADHARQ